MGYLTQAEPGKEPFDLIYGLKGLQTKSFPDREKYPDFSGIKHAGVNNTWALISVDQVMA